LGTDTVVRAASSIDHEASIGSRPWLRRLLAPALLSDNGIRNRTQQENCAERYTDQPPWCSGGTERRPGDEGNDGRDVPGEGRLAASFVGHEHRMP